MLSFIHSIDFAPAVETISARIISFLKENKKVLWLVPGGSNIAVAVSIMKKVQDSAAKSFLKNLTITLTDERYGPVGHSDSNWQQLTDAGFDFNNINTIPVLLGLSFEETIFAFGKNVEAAAQSADVTIGFFGMGSDGHIAGVLPHTIGVSSTDVACGYVAEKFTRITLALSTLKKLDIAYLCAFGSSKREQLDTLRNMNISLGEQPVQILKGIEEVTVFSDQAA